MKDRPRLIIDTDDDYTLRDFNGDVFVRRCRTLYASGAKIGGSLDASRAEISGSLNASGATIGCGLYADGAKIGGGLYASGATIGGNLDTSDAKIGGGLYASGATIGGNLDTSDAKIGGELRAGSATIGGNLNAFGATIDGVTITEPTEAEITRLREIIRIAEEQPETFEMSEWHCGTTHCAYGWNQVLDGMEVDNSTCQEYGQKTLPSIYHLVFSTNDIFLKNVQRNDERKENENNEAHDH